MGINTGRKISAWWGREREREGEKRRKMEIGREMSSLFFSPEPTKIESVPSLWNPRVNILTLKNLYSKQVPHHLHLAPGTMTTCLEHCNSQLFCLFLSTDAKPPLIIPRTAMIILLKVNLTMPSRIIGTIEPTGWSMVSPLHFCIWI